MGWVQNSFKKGLLRDFLACLPVCWFGFVIRSFYFFSRHVLQFDGIILKLVLLLLPNAIIILTTKFTLSDFACIIFAFWIVSFWLIVKFRLLLFPWSYSSTYVSRLGEKKINLSEAHIIFIDFPSLSMFNDEKRRIRKKRIKLMWMASYENSAEYVENWSNFLQCNLMAQ